jgi:cation diffusion facilitator family transporter
MHNHNHTHHHFGFTKDSSKLVKFATYASVTAASIIIVAKIIGWMVTGSLTLLASLADSALDITASIINLVAVHYASKPADNEHRFGHGKAEDLSVFTQSAFFTFSGLFLGFEAIRRLFYPEVVENSQIGIAVMVFSIVITALLVSFQQYVIKRSKSNVIEADKLHYVSDLLVNLAVIVSLLITSKWKITYIDSIIALIIAAYILNGALKLLKRAFNNLMDHELDEADKKIILDIVKNHPKVIGLHDLKTRLSGNKAIIQFHLEMSGDMTLNEAHVISIDIEGEILAHFPYAEIIIHQDPEGADEKVEYHQH